MLKPIPNYWIFSSPRLGGTVDEDCEVSAVTDTRNCEYIDSPGSSIEQGLTCGGYGASCCVHIVYQQHGRAVDRAWLQHLEGSLDRPGAIPGIQACAMTLGGLDPFERAIVDLQTEFSTDQTGDDCCLIESALSFSKAM